MAMDALRSYLQLASGLTDVTRDRARAAASALLASGPLEDGAQAVTSLGTKASASVAALTDDLLAASRTNRDLLVGLIRSEVDRAVGRLGVATNDEMDALSRRVAKLERTQAPQAAAVLTSPAEKKPAKKSPAKKSPATKRPVKKRPAEVGAAETDPVPSTTETATTAGLPATPGPTTSGAVDE